MTSDQLLEVLGGKDLLVMMCDAKRFSAEKGGGSVKFWVGPYIVEISLDYPKGWIAPRYTLTVRNRKTKNSDWGVGVDNNTMRRLFERYTGYSLSF